MEEVFGSDGESDREGLQEAEAEGEGEGEGVEVATPHDIADLEEDDDLNGDAQQAESFPQIEQPQQTLKEEAKDIFGSDDEDEELETGEENETLVEKPSAAADPDLFVRKSQDTSAENDDLFGSDDDGEEDVDGNSNKFLSENPMKKSSSATPSHSKLCLPNIHRLSEDSQMLLKVPGFVKFQPKPYNPSTYDPEVESSLFNHAPDIIRWRYQLNSRGEIIKDGQGVPLRESNSRLVKWSDGTYQLIIGEEVFEGQLVPVNDSFIYAQQYSAPSKEMESSQEENGSQSDIKKGSVLECVGTIANKLNILVSSVTSMTHERMSLKTNEQYRKAIKIKTRVDSVVNPEKESEARIGAINEQLKRERRRALQASDQYAPRGTSGYSSRASMSAAYLQEGFEDDRNYDSVSIKSIKRGENGSKKFGSNKKSINLEDEDDEDDEDDDGDPSEMKDFIVGSDDDGDEEEEEGEYVDEEEEDDDDPEIDEEEDEGGGNRASKSNSSKPQKVRDPPLESLFPSHSFKKKSQKSSKEKKKTPSKKSSRREEEGDSGDDFAAPQKKKAPVSVRDEDTEESQQKKRLKRTIVDSDDDSS